MANSKKRKIKNKKLMILAFLLLVISVGFAYLTTNLSILGSTFLKSQTWDVHFENVQVSENGVQITTPTITENRTKVEYDITLDKPGDFVEFTVDAKNDGTIDAMIKTITPIAIYDGEEKLAKIPDYLDYSITYVNGKELAVKHLLKKGTSATYKVHIEYKKNITKEQLVKSKKNLKAEFDVEYVQADDSAIDVSTGAKLLTGEEINAKIKSFNVDGDDEYFVIEQEEDGFTWEEEVPNPFESIKHIKKATTIKEEDKIEDNLISEEDSDSEVYVFLDEENDTIYYYTDADKVYLNANSYGLFRALPSLEDIEMDIFDTSNVEDFGEFFYEDQGLKELDLSNFDTSSATSFSSMFFFCTGLNELDLGSFVTDNATDMSYMFLECAALEDLNISSFNTSKVENMDSMFSGCESLTELSVRHFDVSNVKYFMSIFERCSSLTSLDVDDWVVSNMIEAEWMFSFCSSLESLNINSWDVKKLEQAYGMFYMCEGLTTLDLNNWNTPKLQHTGQMFAGCSSLTNLKISKWNVENVENTESMFSDLNIEEIDLSGWNTASLQSVHYMFSNDSNLRKIYVGKNFNVSNLTSDSAADVFEGCTLLSGGNGTNYSASNTDYSMFTIDGYRYSNGTWVEDNTARGYLTMKK